MGLVSSGRLIDLPYLKMDINHQGHVDFLFPKEFSKEFTTEFCLLFDKSQVSEQSKRKALAAGVKKYTRVYLESEHGGWSKDEIEKMRNFALDWYKRNNHRFEEIKDGHKRHNE